jgi:penicillin amidase
VRMVKRLVAVLLVVVVIGAVGAIGAVAYITGRALPQVDGTLALAGLDAPVQVHRDVDGIVNISATTTHDLFAAQGYVHAQERMWQMEVWRHISAGRLAELFGGADQL